LSVSGRRSVGASLSATAPEPVPARVAVVAETGLAGRRAAEILRREGYEVVADPSADPCLDSEVAAVVFVTDEFSAVTHGVRHLDDPPLVVIAPVADRRTIGEAINMGVSGFVPEADADARLGPTLRAVCAGQVAVPAELRQALATPLLSPREKQVMSMVVLGFTNCEIAARLYVTERTVKSHLSSAYRKLGVRSRQQATALILNASDGLGLGVLSLSPDPGPVPIAGVPR
jgi:DNA-binding NarL/FixJ family response regulator